MAGTKADSLEVTTSSFEAIAEQADGMTFSVDTTGSGVAQQHETQIESAFLIQFENKSSSSASISVPTAGSAVTSNIPPGGVIVLACSQGGYELTGPVSVTVVAGGAYELVVAGAKQ